MKARKTWKGLALLLLPLLTLASGCATNSPPSVAVDSPRIPPLPEAARQPTPPKECSPTCSEALTKRRKESLDTLMKLESPAVPAKPRTTP